MNVYLFELILNNLCLLFTLCRWDETSDESGSMEPSNSEDERLSDHNRRPRRQAAVATKKKQAKRNAARRKNYSSGDESESDDEHKRCVYVYILIRFVLFLWLDFVATSKNAFVISRQNNNRNVKVRLLNLEFSPCIPK